MQAAKLRATHTALSSKKKNRPSEPRKPQQDALRLESTERHDRISYPPISLDALTWSATDYQDVPIPENSVIYCDIPYKGTNKYAGKGRDFDHDRFYEWALRQTVPVYVSEYAMPEDFVEVAAWEKRCTMKSAEHALRTTEKLFVPRWQAKDLGFRTA